MRNIGRIKVAVLEHEKVGKHARQAAIPIIERMDFQELDDEVADDKNRMKLLFYKLLLYKVHPYFFQFPLVSQKNQLKRKMEIRK